jgi:nitrous oxidase accessory protein NosD
MPSIRAGRCRMAAAATVLFALLCASSASAAGTITVCGSGCDSTTIQGGIGLATDGDTINVGPGTYAEDVTVNKSVTLVGAGSGTSGSIVKGVVGGGSSTFAVAAPGVVIDSFRISRFGNSVADWNDDLNSAGVSVPGQTNTVELKNSRLLGNRTGIDINNSNGNSIH